MRSGLHGARARTWTATTAAWLSLVSATAHAEPTKFDIVWSAPAECPSGEQIVAATRARLGARPSEEAPALFVQGNVTPANGGFFVALVIEDVFGHPVGRRQVRVEGPDCSAVADATALVLAMIIASRPRESPVATTTEDPAPPPPPSSSVSTAPESKGPRAVPVRTPRARPTPPRRVLFGASVIASHGVLPRAGFGLALRTAYSPSPPVFLAIETSFEDGGSLRDGTAEVNFQFAGGSALAGRRVLQAAQMELILTLHARGGVLRASGTGFRATQHDARPIAFVGPGALLRAKLAPSLFVEAFPLAEVVLIRDRFHLRDGEVVVPIHKPAPVAGRLSLGIAYEFP